MKVLCPKCGQVIQLDHLEKSGGQRSYCDKCKIYIQGIYEKGVYKETWDVNFERSFIRNPTKEGSNPGKKGSDTDGCLSLIGIVGGIGLVLLLLYLFLG